MKFTFPMAMSAAGRGTIAGVFDLSLLLDLVLAVGKLVFGLLIYAIRLLVLLTFPISTPLIAWILMRWRVKRAAQIDAAIQVAINRVINPIN